MKKINGAKIKSPIFISKVIEEEKVQALNKSNNKTSITFCDKPASVFYRREEKGKK